MILIIGGKIGPQKCREAKMLCKGLALSGQSSSFTGEFAKNYAYPPSQTLEYN